MTDTTPEQKHDRRQYMNDLAQIVPRFLQAAAAAAGTSLNPPDAARAAGIAFRTIMELATSDAALPAAEAASLLDELADAFKSGLQQNVVAVKMNVPDGATVAGSSGAVH